MYDLKTLQITSNIEDNHVIYPVSTSLSIHLHTLALDRSVGYDQFAYKKANVYSKKQTGSSVRIQVIYETR